MEYIFSNTANIKPLYGLSFHIKQYFYLFIQLIYFILIRKNPKTDNFIFPYNESLLFNEFLEDFNIKKISIQSSFSFAKKPQNTDFNKNWMDFFWNVFYKKGAKENEEKELKIFHEFDEEMYNFI